MQRKILWVLMVTVALLCVLPQTVAQQRQTVDKVVAVVGNSIVLYSEIDEVSKAIQQQRREQGYTLDKDIKIEALEVLLEQKLLYNQAIIDSIEISLEHIVQAADERVGEMVADLGSVQKLEELFHRPIYEIKKEVGNRFEEQQYAQKMRQTVESKVAISPGEVKRFYNSLPADSIPIVPIQYEYSQITKLPLSTNNAKMRARESLLNMRERIIGGTRFSTLARLYSDDGSASNGGEMPPMSIEQFEKPFGDAVERLKVGQVSGIIETIYGFHIAELLGKQGNAYTVRHILIRPQFTSEEMLDTNRFLDSLVRLIRADSISFKEVAAKYSDDKFSKQNAGVVSNLEMLETSFAMDAAYATTKHYKENLPANDFRALDGLKVGEISKAFKTEDMRGNTLSKVVKLDRIIPSHKAELDTDYLDIEELALDQKRIKQYEEWLDKKISTMFIRISPEFRIEEEFDNKSWLK